MKKNRLAIIADDFTGALDTGVQFAQRGIPIEVVLSVNGILHVSAHTDVAVVDTQSRHISPEKAYNAVFDAVRMVESVGFTHIYKKTDSGMRGNIGSELKAAVDASGKKCLSFVPALPKAGRTVENGIAFIDGKPAAQGIFSKDPFNPVKHSSVSDIIGETADIQVLNNKKGEGIVVYDSKTEEDLLDVGQSLCAEELELCAGCAAFASYLPQLVGLSGTEKKSVVHGKGLIVISGSVNPVTLRQMEKAQEDGFLRYVLSGKEKTNPDFFASGNGDSIVGKLLEKASGGGTSVVDIGCKEDFEDPDMWKNIALNLGNLAKRILDTDNCVNIMCTGGDVLSSALEVLKCSNVLPVEEVLQGVVLAEINYNGRTVSLFTKSGGFGPENLVMQLSERVLRR